MLPGGYLCKKWNLKYGGSKEWESMTTDLTEGTPWKIIMRFSIPLFFTFLLQQFYNMVDTIVVGQFLGKDALAGVGSTGAINFMIIGFCMGLANGFVIPVAQRYGAKDYKDMRRFVANSIWLTVFFAAIMSITVCILCRSVLIAMKTPADILDLAYDYIFIILRGYRSHLPTISDRDHPFSWDSNRRCDLSADGSSGKYRI